MRSINLNNLDEREVRTFKFTKEKELKMELVAITVDRNNYHAHLKVYDDLYIPVEYTDVEKEWVDHLKCYKFELGLISTQTLQKIEETVKDWDGWTISKKIVVTF